MFKNVHKIFLIKFNLLNCNQKQFYEKKTFEDFCIEHLEKKEYQRN